MITNSIEDYLEVIFHLESEGKSATTLEISKHLRIAPGSVTEKLKNLHQKGFIKHIPYKNVSLLPKGKKAALDVVRRHRLSERFLQDKLGMSWNQVHEEAHRIEHSLSKKVSNKLYELLGKPKTCPHGNPIPDSNGHILNDRSYPLTKLKKHNKAEIQKITDEDPKLLTYLHTLGLMPKTRLTIEEKAPFHGPIIIKISNSSYALGEKIAESIWVKKI